MLGCDDTAQGEFLNKDRLKGNLAGPGKSQSNLWFVDPPQLDGTFANNADPTYDHLGRFFYGKLTQTF